MSGRVRIDRLTGAALAIAVALAPAARAAEDAGTRSIFATGAGNRALAMGGAYVALADDASSLFWNPGGLGLVTRREFQATRTSYALGMNEANASFAVPSWRWGTTALGLRYFGVDGIESRDDRNQVLAADLTDTETEITVGYGRSVGEAWSMGGALKLQRQSLAGFTATGLGADLGLTVRPLVALGSSAAWADRLSWGLAMRNAVEPGLRLDRESVPDPMTVRTGVAWRGGPLLASVDLEAARGVAARVHTGVEWVPHPLLALRAGLDRGTLTTGAGLRWGDLGVDYVFENRGLGAVHRAGVSLPFGPTTADARRVAQRADEQKLEAKLAEAFQRQEDQRMTVLLARADSARAARRFDEAYEVLGTALTLQPERAEALTLEARCLREHAAGLERAGEWASAVAVYARLRSQLPGDSAAVAGEARARAESDRRAARSDSLRQAFALAMDAFGNDDLPAARRGFLTVLGGAPGDSDAVAMLRRTDLVIVRRCEGLLREARHALASGRLDEAATLAGQVAALDARADGLAQLSAAISEARSAATAAPTVVPASTKKLGLTPQQRRDNDDLYRRALAALKDRRPDDAIRYWEMVWASDPSYPRVVESLKREYLTRGLEAFAAGRLDEAVANWEKAVRVDPQDERARGYLARALKQRARTHEILGVVR